jgi:plasmid stabilization system protein ParE
MRVRLTEQAQADARRIRHWWRRHRSKAPERFVEESRSARHRLATAPLEGQVYVELRGLTVRRLLLSKSGHHVYYVVDLLDDVVSILAIYGATRGSEPDLGS